MKLDENIILDAKSITKIEGPLPEGVLRREIFPICNLDKRNHNKRIYRRAVWDKVCNDPEIKEKLRTRTLFGQAEHPEGIKSDLQLTSHVINKFIFDESTNRVLQEVDILDTPSGRIVATLRAAGCLVGMSTRAEGDVREAVDNEGKYLEVIPELYGYRTTDFTADPSTFNSMPEASFGSVIATVKESFEHRGISKSLAESILVALGEPEALKIKDEIETSKDCECNPGFACGSCGKCSNESKQNEASNDGLPNKDEIKHYRAYFTDKSGNQKIEEIDAKSLEEVMAIGKSKFSATDFSKIELASKLHEQVEDINGNILKVGDEVKAGDIEGTIEEIYDGKTIAVNYFVGEDSKTENFDIQDDNVEKINESIEEDISKEQYSELCKKHKQAKYGVAPGIMRLDGAISKFKEYKDLLPEDKKSLKNYYNKKFGKTESMNLKINEMKKVLRAKYEDSDDWVTTPEKIKEMINSHLELQLEYDDNGEISAELSSNLIGTTVLVGTEEVEIKESKSMNLKINDQVKILEGEHKDKSGKITAINEGVVSVELTDGSIITINTAINDVNIIGAKPVEVPADIQEKPAEPIPAPEPIDKVDNTKPDLDKKVEDLEKEDQKESKLKENDEVVDTEDKLVAELDKLISLRDIATEEADEDKIKVLNKNIKEIASRLQQLDVELTEPQKDVIRSIDESRLEEAKQSFQLWVFFRKGSADEKVPMIKKAVKSAGKGKYHGEGTDGNTYDISFGFKTKEDAEKAKAAVLKLKGIDRATVRIFNESKQNESLDAMADFISNKIFAKLSKSKKDLKKDHINEYVKKQINSLLETKELNESTHAIIGIQNSDGSVDSVSIHWDGQNALNKLQQYYTDESKAKELISLGNISSLEKDIGTKHDFNNRPKDETTFYGRDRGEPDASAIHHENITDFIKYAGFYTYIAIYKDGKWVNAKNIEESKQSKPSALVTSHVKAARILEAIATAERDKALEVINNLEESNKLDKQLSTELKSLVSKLTEALSYRDNDINGLSQMLEKSKSESKQLRLMLAGLTKQLASKSRNFTIKIHESESKNKALKDEFIKYLLEKVNFNLGSNSKALLESCSTIGEITGVFEQIIESARVDALHPKNIGDISMHSVEQTTRKTQIKESIRKVKG